MKKRGVSLIVLVVTIIVLAILAGVVVANLNDDKIIDRAENTRDNSNLKTAEDALSVAYTDWSIKHPLDELTSISQLDFDTSIVPEKYEAVIVDGEPIIDIKTITVTAGDTTKDNLTYIKSILEEGYKLGYEVPEALSSNWVYTTDGTLTAYKGEDKVVIIPTVINGVNIKKIGESFTANSRAATASSVSRNVIILNNIKEIQDGAFKDNYGEIYVPNTVKKIAADALYSGNLVSGNTVYLGFVDSSKLGITLNNNKNFEGNDLDTFTWNVKLLDVIDSFYN